MLFRSRRAITQKLVGADGTLALVTFAAPVERALADAVHRGEDGAGLVLDPLTAQRLVGRLRGWMERFVTEGATPILLCGATLRPWIRRFLERYVSGLVVLAPAEIGTGIRVRSLGVVTLDDA